MESKCGYPGTLTSVTTQSGRPIKYASEVLDEGSMNVIGTQTTVPLAMCRGLVRMDENEAIFALIG